MYIENLVRRDPANKPWFDQCSIHHLPKMAVSEALLDAPLSPAPDCGPKQAAETTARPRTRPPCPSAPGSPMRSQSSAPCSSQSSAPRPSTQSSAPRSSTQTASATGIRRPETSSLNAIMRENNRERLFVTPLHWRSQHIQLLDCSFVLKSRAPPQGRASDEATYGQASEQAIVSALYGFRQMCVPSLRASLIRHVLLAHDLQPARQVLLSTSTRTSPSRPPTRPQQIR